MLFEVITRDGRPVMQTDHQKCIYDKDTLKEIQQSGYSFRVNGKRASLQTVLDVKGTN